MGILGEILRTLGIGWEYWGQTGNTGDHLGILGNKLGILWDTLGILGLGRINRPVILGVD